MLSFCLVPCPRQHCSVPCPQLVCLTLPSYVSALYRITFCSMSVQHLISLLLSTVNIPTPKLTTHPPTAKYCSHFHFQANVSPFYCLVHFHSQSSISSLYCSVQLIFPYPHCLTTQCSSHVHMPANISSSYRSVQLITPHATYQIVHIPTNQK